MRRIRLPLLCRSTLALSLLLAACSTAPATVPGDMPADPADPGGTQAEPAPNHPHLTPTDSPSVAPSDDPGPSLVRPAWNGQRKPSETTPQRTYPATYKGDRTVSELAMVGQRLYTADQGLYAVPVSSGSWSVVPGTPIANPTHMTSDGAHLFVGNDRGEIGGMDPTYGKSGVLGNVPSAVTGLGMVGNQVVVGTANDGVYRLPASGGSAQALQADPGARTVQALAAGDQGAFTLAGDRAWAWPLSGASHAILGSEGATSLTACRGVLYLGTADGWVLRSRDDGQSVQAIAHVCDYPLETVGTDGNWLYAASGNTTYMLDLKRYVASPCHSGFPAAVTNLTILDGATALVGTKGRGLTSMPR